MNMNPNLASILRRWVLDEVARQEAAIERWERWCEKMEALPSDPDAPRTITFRIVS